MIAPVVVGGLMAASSVVGFMGQKRQEKRAKAAAKTQMKFDLHALKAQADEIVKAGYFQMEDVRRAGAETLSQAVVAGGESGVSGKVSSAVRQDIQGDRARAELRVSENTRSQLEQNYRQIDATRAGYQMRLAGITSPSLLGLGLNIASGYAWADAQYGNKSQ